jgi:hypothetical protein
VSGTAIRIYNITNVKEFYMAKTIYETSDGQLSTSYNNARAHQDSLDKTAELRAKYGHLSEAELEAETARVNRELAKIQRETERKKREWYASLSPEERRKYDEQRA